MKQKKVIALLLTSALLATSAQMSTYAASGILSSSTVQAVENQQTPPEPPSGGQPGTASGSALGGQPGAASGSALGRQPGGAPGGQPGGSSSSVMYSAAKEITSAATESDKTYASTTTDESALIVNTSEQVTLKNIKLTKSGSSNGGDNCNFYGLNAGLLVMGGSTTTIQGGMVTTDADGANGIFSYGGNGAINDSNGDGTTVNVSDVTITTTGNGSGGIMTTGGGKTNATNLTITTNGGSSAPIRTDRGGGTVNVTGGTYTSNGLGSPAIYSTADITVKNAKLTSNLSEGVCIEGKNSIKLTDCELTANNTQKNGNAQFLDTIMIYQSMSGDASSGSSTFVMSGGKLTSKSGHVFHVTNTNAVINLENVTISNTDSGDVLLSVANDGWSGASNIATLNAKKQELSGGIIVSNAASSASSSTSKLTLNLTDGSTYTGAIGDGSDNTKVGTVDVSIDSKSTWKLSGDSYISSISGADRIDYNGHTLFVNGTAYTASNPTGDVAATETTDTTATTPSTGQDTGATGENAADSDDSATALKNVVLKNKTKTISASKLKNKKVTFNILKSKNTGAVTSKAAKKAAKAISVSKTGVVTVKKGTKKGVYKVNVTVAGNKNYARTMGTITIKVK